MEWENTFINVLINKCIFSFNLLYKETEAFEAGLNRRLMKTAAIGDRSTPESDHMTATIMVEGTKILEGNDIPRVCDVLTGI